MKRGKNLFLLFLAVLFSFLLCVNKSVEAITITVDGDLSDLKAVQSLSYNTYSAGDAEETGSSGFDIKNSYFYYDYPTDTFFVGIEVFGTVGLTGGFNEQFLGGSTNFDAQEGYRFTIDLDNDGLDTLGAGVDVTVMVIGDGGAGTGPDSLYSGNVTRGGTVAYAVSETLNGVEFSISGLNPLATATSPRDFGLTIFAGTSWDTLADDTAVLTGVIVPEPASVLLLGSGLAGLAGFSYRRKKK